MSLLQLFLLAFRQLRKSPMRALLTTLGVLIGTAAVIAMVVIGRGATATIEGQLSGLGENLMFMAPGRPSGGMGSVRIVAPMFKTADATAIARSVRGLRAVAPVLAAPVHVVRGGTNWSTIVTGITVDYLKAMTWRIANGRPLSSEESRAGAPVCLLGETVRMELFGDTDPVGQEVRLGAVTATVIGVLAPRGRTAFGQDPDDTVLAPLALVQRRIVGTDDVASVVLSADEGASTSAIVREINAVMRTRRHIAANAEADFVVRDMKEIAQMVGTITGVLSSLLAAIASISLLVGGIGIMNIMLVAVTERTREIGMRLAIGATSRDVLLQFLIEAVVLSGLGGVAGVAVGLGGAYLATEKLGAPFVVDTFVLVLPLAFSIVIGVIFGFVPARQAARLRPIVALRHE
jgi:putative ABC transport system permease protein